ncbi:MAG: hypothetical protein IJ055_02125 [Oscillospiraceae bacterium]|nr:hypothetical protein [Oscillospiraceae bacterium]
MAKNTHAPEHYITGDYAVGTACFSLVDTGRREVLGRADGDRRIAVRLYYPAVREDTAGCERAQIFSPNKMAAIRKAYHIPRIPEEQNRAEYYADIPFAPGQFPLILFSMGYNSYVEANTYLLCTLASHGYVIASVGHAYEAVENDYEDGSFDLYDRTINKRMYTSMLGALRAQNKLLRRACSFEEALAQFEQFQRTYTPYIKDRVPQWERDLLTALGAVRARYGEHLDEKRGIGASGHSLGGCLAYYLCRYHDEFSCGINIDGGLFGDYPDRTMEKPFCQICCRENLNVVTRPFVGTRADTYRVIFDRMKHMGFTDAKFYIPIKALAGGLDPQELFRHLTYCHVTFFDRYLKGVGKPFDALPSEFVRYKRIV